MANLPDGTVTFLLTDIEGSTQLLQRLREEYASVLATQRMLLRDAFSNWNGVEVDTQGDSFFVAFARAGDAVNAAIKAQRALSENVFPQDTRVQVRMGMHTGEPQISDTHYVGIDVHRAARIAAAAHGGQVLLSQTTRELVESDLPAGVSLRDLGEHRLKDLRRAEHLYQLVIAGLPSEFPPVKSLQASPNNMPLQLTSFVGREKEIKEVKEALERARLVTLTGVGGTGKTRLALHVAAEVIDDFQDGVWLVELAPLTEPALVPQAIAASLGLREQPGRAFLELLKDYLAAKHLLLVLDNCEHLIEECAQVADVLLHAAPHLKILATSREGLGIAGESTYHVHSLSLPDNQTLQAEALSQYDAVRLFIDRAVAVQPTFQVTNQNALAVAQVCARLDGIPLAIELAAARVKGLSAEQIASRLDDRFRLLTGGSRTALPRQRTLQAAIDWSYRLLAEQERVLLRRLSVFAGGWTIKAAEFVCASKEIESNDILELLLRLVDKSLVVAETKGTQPRYHMLETIRQYAQEKLDESGEAEHVRTRHLDFFLQLAEESEPKFLGADFMQAYQPLEQDLDNFRAALEWSLTGEKAEEGLRIAGSFANYWWDMHHRNEGLVWLQRLLAAPSGQSRTRARAKALGVAAVFDYDPSKTHGLALECLEISRELEYSEGVVYGLRALGSNERYFGNPETARAYFAESLPLLPELPHSNITYLTFWQASSVEIDQNDWGAAQALIEEALLLARQAAEAWLNVYVLRLGYITLCQGHLARARQLIEEGLRWNASETDDFTSAISLVYLGLLEFYERNYEQAGAHIEDVIRLLRLAQADDELPLTLSDLADVKRCQGEYEQASKLYQESLALAMPSPDKHAISYSLKGTAMLAAARQQDERAARVFGAAEALRELWRLPLKPVEEPDYESAIAGLHARLDDAKFNAAWNDGRASILRDGASQALEQAIELALRED